MENVEIGKTPEIFCEIAIYFDNKKIELARKSIMNLSIGPVVCRRDPLMIGFSYINFARVYYKQYWDIDDALTEMFSKIDVYIPQICEIINEFQGKAMIDIALCVYETFPALLFSGENMRKIHMMNADISIDPYYYGSSDNSQDESIM